VSAPGIHFDMPEADYHADPCPAPSLSSSVARVLIEQSPAHARAMHPRLCPDAKSPESDRLALGAVVHALVLGRGAKFHVVGATDYKTKAAREERDGAIAMGWTPIKAADMAEAERIAKSVDHHIASDLDVFDTFTAGASEAVLIWREADAWCRAMVDKLFIGDRDAVIYDIKTTDQSAHPMGLARKVLSMGYDLRAAFYMRGLARLRPDLAGRIRFRWVFVETSAPYAVTVAELDGAGLTIGDKKAATAIALWQRCVRDDAWPTWPIGVHRLESPPWAEQQWLARETDDPTFAGLMPVIVAPEPPARRMEFAP